MMADNIEHVICYWVMFQNFHSPALGGFAVISHWVPFLLAGGITPAGWPIASTSAGSSKLGMLLFMGVSIGWGVMFLTDPADACGRRWCCCIVHGLAGVIWLPASQVLIHQIVCAGAVAERGAVERHRPLLGVFGRAAPSVRRCCWVFGPAYGIFINALIYTPLFLWLISAPYGGAACGGARPAAGRRRLRRHLVDDAGSGAQSACCCR